MFAGQVKIVSHSSCRTRRAIVKCFCPLINVVLSRGISVCVFSFYYSRHPFCNIIVLVPYFLKLQTSIVAFPGPKPRAHPVISHCSHLLLKCRVVTNISHWLKEQSRWFKNYISTKKCILISLWIFQSCFCNSFTLYYCAIFNSSNAEFS